MFRGSLIRPNNNTYGNTCKAVVYSTAFFWYNALMWNILLIEKGDESSRLLFPKLPLYDMMLQRESDASAALALLTERQYDLLLVDGDDTDVAFLPYLEQLRRMSDAPVLVITKKDDEADVIRILNAGADDCLKRPLRTGEALARMRAALRARERYSKTEMLPDGSIERRGIRIDTVNRRVYVRRREKRMTRREYDLLLFLMRHPDRVYTREELYRAVWNDDAVGGTATVTVHIRKLRDKIEERPSEPTIIGTEWGVGYLFLSEEKTW